MRTTLRGLIITIVLVAATPAVACVSLFKEGSSTVARNDCDYHVYVGYKLRSGKTNTTKLIRSLDWANILESEVVDYRWCDSRSYDRGECFFDFQE